MIFFSPFREKLYFTAQPETMMIKIEHAVLATKFLGRGSDLAASQRNMKGYLYGHNGTALKRQLKVDYIFVVLIRLLNCHLKTLVTNEYY